ncbi:xylose isomerase [Gordoniibacillus kamchatkensis]|uniref:Xylose isomerase n=1 Tax=Gordoniibacillus kamchatkensis TaxID=1590651 RepID=A0ABR5AIL2_9BACL|nr:TIM barrel protein [Paenibacillus sp. VKM B-2647]KIL40871.1 xylose isomerase [Paenibacillus sp. VKM B-2647]
MKLSIGGFSFFNSMNAGTMDLFGYLESVKYRYRLNAADLWNGQFGRDASNQIVLPDDDAVKKIRAALDERQLIVPNIAIDSAHLIDADPGMTDKLYQNALANMRVAEMLGAKTVRIDFCTAKTSEISERQFEYIVGKYRELCDRAAAGGYFVGPENHMGAALDPYLLKRIAEAVDHPNFGILLHLGRWNPDQVHVGDKLVAPWVVHTHVDTKTAAAEENALASLKALHQAGYDGYWAVEHNAKDNQYEEIEWMLAAVKKLLRTAERNN